MNPNGVKLKKKTEINNTELKKQISMKLEFVKKNIYIYIYTHMRAFMSSFKNTQNNGRLLMQTYICNKSIKHNSA